MNKSKVPHFLWPTLYTISNNKAFKWHHESQGLRLKTFWNSETIMDRIEITCLVSAMLVAMTILCTPGGGRSNTLS